MVVIAVFWTQPLFDLLLHLLLHLLLYIYITFYIVFILLWHSFFGPGYQWVNFGFAQILKFSKKVVYNDFLLCEFCLCQTLNSEDNAREASLGSWFLDVKFTFYLSTLRVESTKTMSMEDVSTGELKNKEYLRSKDKAKKWLDVSRHI